MLIMNSSLCLPQTGQGTQKHLWPSHTSLRIMNTGGHQSDSISFHPLGRNYMGNGHWMSPPKDDTVSCNEGHSVSLSRNHTAVTMNLFVENLGPNEAGDLHWEQTWKLNQSSPVLLITDLHTSWVVRPELTQRGQDHGTGNANLSSSTKPGLKSPSQSLGHDCCATMDRLCSRLLLLTLPDCECSASLPWWWKSPFLL
jgi:hypothetical protein